MATNTLDAYSPQLYANKALDILKNRFGLASRINRQYDDERRSFERGDVVTVRRPSVFTAQSAPSSAQNLATGKIQITLDGWQEVKIELPDKEKAFTGERIIREHIEPMATALSTKVETDLNTMALLVPHAYVEPSAATAATVAGILGTWRKLFDNKCPTVDEANMFFELGGKEWADLAQLTAFAQFQGAGQLGVNTQVTGQLGTRYGFQFFPTQLRPTVAYADITDFAGATSAIVAKDATSMPVTGLGTVEVYKKGSIIKMTSGTDLGSEYSVTADVTMVAGAGTFVVSPATRNAMGSGDTFSIGNTQGEANGNQDLTVSALNNVNLAFHRNFAAAVFAPLPDYAEYANRLGADIATVTDPDSGITLRARVYYVGGSSKMECALDILYGYKMLQPEYACRYEIKSS